MAHDSANALATATGLSYLEAPAGFGKTEVIADALALCEHRQLILTHTHAGVDSLKKRLKSKGVPSSRFRVETIDAFCMRYARGYPTTSGFEEPIDDDPEVWARAKEGASKVLGIQAIQDILSSAFAGVIVDEYQDCSKAQHEIISLLARSLPLRILGDPLQSLFTWTGQDPISWVSDIVEGGFTALPSLSQPQRWLQPGASAALGEWITTSRTNLSKGEAPNYGEPVKLYETSKAELNQNLLTAISYVQKLSKTGETIVILHPRFTRPAKTDPKPHLRITDPFASALSGRGFSVMMEIEGKLLRNWCAEICESRGLALALALLEFADECCSKCTQELAPVIKALTDNTLDKCRTQKAKSLLDWLTSNGQDLEFEGAEEWLKLLGRFNGRKIHHRELFMSMAQALRRVAVGKDATLTQAARAVREQQSHAGRWPERRIISRTLLVKGLQYEHVIVVCPEDMDACHQYVAFSRAVKSLTVVTTNKLGIKRGKATLEKPAPNAPVEEPAQQGSLFA